MRPPSRLLDWRRNGASELHKMRFVVTKRRFNRYYAYFALLFAIEHPPYRVDTRHLRRLVRPAKGAGYPIPRLLRMIWVRLNRAAHAAFCAFNEKVFTILFTFNKFALAGPRRTRQRFFQFWHLFTLPGHGLAGGFFLPAFFGVAITVKTIICRVCADAPIWPVASEI